MILKKDSVCKLLYQLGFTGALRWDDDKLREVARLVPTHYKADEISKRYQELYAQLCKAAKTKEFITLTKSKLT
jgi:hypothetical protein